MILIFFTSFQNPNESRNKPATTAKIKVKAVYIIVDLSPKNAKNKVIIAGFNIGEVSKNDIVPEIWAPLFNNPTNMWNGRA